MALKKEMRELLIVFQKENFCLIAICKDERLSSWSDLRVRVELFLRHFSTAADETVKSQTERDQRRLNN